MDEECFFVHINGDSRVNIEDECLFETYDRINDVESAIQLLT